MQKYNLKAAAVFDALVKDTVMAAEIKQDMRHEPTATKAMRLRTFMESIAWSKDLLKDEGIEV